MDAARRRVLADYLRRADTPFEYDYLSLATPIQRHSIHWREPTQRPKEKAALLHGHLRNARQMT